MADHEHDQDYDGGTERTPLVGESAHASQPRRPSHRPMLSMASIASVTSIHVPKAHTGRTIILLLSAIAMVVCMATGFLQIPLTKVVENAVCRQYYNQAQSLEAPIDEKLCKVPEVQSKMAYIFATVDVCEAIAGFFAAFPWGIAADRYATKRPLCSNYCLRVLSGCSHIPGWVEGLFSPFRWLGLLFRHCGI